MKRLQVAIVGTGFIGPAHAEAVRRNSDLAELKAVIGSTPEKARLAAENLNIPFSSDDYRDLFDLKDLDVVHICTPNHLHFSMVKECLEQGLNVLCEKPLAMTSKEAGELMTLAAEKGLKAAVNYNLRYYPMVQEMRTLNQEKSAGRIFALQGSYLQDWLIHENDYSWRLESALSGKSRAVADIGTHWMDMVQYTTGLKIEKVFAQFGRMFDSRKKPDGESRTTFNSKSDDKGSYVSYEVDTEDHAQILLMFENGVLGNLTVSQVAAGYKNFLEIRQIGTEGSLTWNSESPNNLEIGRRDSFNEILKKDPSLLHIGPASFSAFPGGHQEGYGETLKFLFRDFYRDLAGMVSPEEVSYPTFADGTAEMLLIEAIIESDATGQWVTVPPVSGGKS